MIVVDFQFLEKTINDYEGNKEFFASQIIIGLIHDQDVHPELLEEEALMYLMILGLTGSKINKEKTLGYVKDAFL